MFCVQITRSRLPYTSSAQKPRVIYILTKVVVFLTKWSAAASASLDSKIPTVQCPLSFGFHCTLVSSSLFGLLFFSILTSSRTKCLFGFRWLKLLVLCCCLILIFLLYVSSDQVSLPSSKDFDDAEFRSMRIEDRVLFPDHMMLLISSPCPSQVREIRHCIYSRRTAIYREHKETVIKPVLSTDKYDDLRSIIRCPLPPSDHSAEVELWMKEMEQVEENRDTGHNQSAHSWEMVAYEAALDGETVVVFVKGLNLRQGRVSDPTHFSCHFGLGELDRNETFTTKAISAAQEVVRCVLPPSIRINLDKAHGVLVAIGVDQIYHGKVTNHAVLPSVAVISRSGLGSRLKKLVSHIVP